MTDVEVIRLTAEELESQISEYETKWPEFNNIYSTPTCCAGCMVDYNSWSFGQIIDWDNYTGLRFLRGDEITHE